MNKAYSHTKKVVDGFFWLILGTIYCAYLAIRATLLILISPLFLVFVFLTNDTLEDFKETVVHNYKCWLGHEWGIWEYTGERKEQYNIYLNFYKERKRICERCGDVDKNWELYA